MATDNSTTLTQTEINRENEDIRSLLREFTRTLVLIDARMPVNVPFDAAVTDTIVRIATMETQVDVEFPPVKFPL